MKDTPSQRQVRPLGVFYWGKVWTLSAWRELRHDYRSFRLDRIESLAIREEHFKDEAEKSLAQLLRMIEASTIN